MYLGNKVPIGKIGNDEEKHILILIAKLNQYEYLTDILRQANLAKESKINSSPLNDSYKGDSQDPQRIRFINMFKEYLGSFLNGDLQQPHKVDKSIRSIAEHINQFKGRGMVYLPFSKVDMNSEEVCFYLINERMESIEEELWLVIIKCLYMILKSERLRNIHIAMFNTSYVQYELNINALRSVAIVLKPHLPKLNNINSVTETNKDEFIEYEEFRRCICKNVHQKLKNYSFYGAWESHIRIHTDDDSSENIPNMLRDYSKALIDSIEIVRDILNDFNG